jgi:hypothetical protein
MSVGYTSLPSFISGISSPQSWINEILDLLSYSSTPSQIEYITATPGTIIPGKLYLVGTGSSFATPGTIAVYLTPFPGSIHGIIPPIGTVIQGWTKIAGDWVRNEFYNGAHVILTPGVATTYILPTDFDGVCTVINNSATTVQIQEASGRTPFGTLINTPLPAGVYQVFQNATTAGI